MSDPDYIEFLGHRAEGWSAFAIMVGIVSAIFLAGVVVGALL